MKVSVEWIKSINQEYGSSADPMPSGIDELVEKIGNQLGQVDEVEDLGKRYLGILVAKVEKVTKHPDADKLSICLIDDGGKTKNIKRGQDGLIQVVCGAPNVKAGQLVAWFPPGTTVPSSSDKEPFVIEAREIRGVLSNGMIASAKELAIGDDHEGILVIDQKTIPGQAFSDIYRLNDYIIDIENKMFTHRPDLFGQLGLARELAGIQNQAFKSPNWYNEDASIRVDGRSNGLKLDVKNEIPALVPRFTTVALKDIKVDHSPIWLQGYLSRVGIRPINNVVDVTNFYMMETAQPLHAYDYDKLKTGILGIRLSKKDETLKLLNGKSLKLDQGAIVITDGIKPIGLGGVMGGADTEVDENTKNIILESAKFDMNLTRKTAMSYGLFTDAATRFTKDQSPHQTLPVLLKAAEDIKRLAGGRVASNVIDNKSKFKGSEQVKVSVEFINSRLGTNLQAAEIKKLLQNVEFKVELSGHNLMITPPFWRMDIGIKEDIVEEVGRLYGYSQLPLGLPKRTLEPAQTSPGLEFKQKLRQILVMAGSNEVLTYSFVHDSLLKKTSQDKTQAYQLKNALSPDLKFYRLSLLPSILDKIHLNIKNSYDLFALFELGKAHVKGEFDEEKLPEEFERLGLVFTSKTKATAAAYYQAKYTVGFLFQMLNISGVSFQKLEGQTLNNEWRQAAQPFEPQRSSAIFVNNDLLGLVGEPKESVRQNLKLPPQASMFELNINVLKKNSSPRSYKPISKFPSISQDITLRSSTGVKFSKITDLLVEHLNITSSENGFSFEIYPLNIFSPKDQEDYKQLTWRITLNHPDRTFTTNEANQILDILAKAAKDKYNAVKI